MAREPFSGLDPGRPDAWELLALALDPVEPPPEARSRLMAEVSGRLRYAPFALDLGRHFELAEPDVDALLARVSDAGAWTPGIDPIIGFLHFRPGADLAPLRAGLVRMKAGARVPAHRHRDRELTYVLEGFVLDGTGRAFSAGEAIVAPAGSVHSISVGPDDALIALLHGKIEFLGE